MAIRRRRTARCSAALQCGIALRVAPDRVHLTPQEYFPTNRGGPCSNGKPMRYFPIGARDGTHVPLRVVEDLISFTQVELHVAAPEGCEGIVMVDLGLVEV